VFSSIDGNGWRVPSFRSRRRNRLDGPRSLFLDGCPGLQFLPSSVVTTGTSRTAITLPRLSHCPERRWQPVGTIRTASTALDEARRSDQPETSSSASFAGMAATSRWRRRARQPAPTCRSGSDPDRCGGRSSASVAACMGDSDRVERGARSTWAPRDPPTPRRQAISEMTKTGASWRDLDRSSDSVIMFTAGTTGRPKMVPRRLGASTPTCDGRCYAPWRVLARPPWAFRLEVS
jgi:hypothetical protein